MNIYLFKLILILLFNICVNIYYINSGCKCCDNTKSGGTGSGSKSNLGTNPRKSIKPKPKHKLNNDHNPQKSPNPIVTSHDLKPPVIDHIGDMRMGKMVKQKNIVNLIKITLNADETIQYNELKKNPKVENEETEGIVNDEFKDCIFYSINAELYDSITEESNIQFVNNLSNNSDKYILFAVKTTADNTYVGYCTDGNSSKQRTGLFEESKINKEFKMISCGVGICNICSMFYKNKSLNEVIFLEGFNTSEVIDMSNMFDGCKKLKKLALSKLKSKKVQKIFAMFRECKSLQELNLSNFNNNCSIVKYDNDDIFHNCVKLINIKTNNKKIFDKFLDAKKEERKGLY